MGILVPCLGKSHKHLTSLLNTTRKYCIVFLSQRVRAISHNSSISLKTSCGVSPFFTINHLQSHKWVEWKVFKALGFFPLCLRHAAQQNVFKKLSKGAGTSGTEAARMRDMGGPVRSSSMEISR